MAKKQDGSFWITLFSPSTFTESIVGRLMALTQELLEDNVRVDGSGAEVCIQQEQMRT